MYRVLPRRNVRPSGWAWFWPHQSFWLPHQRNRAMEGMGGRYAERAWGEHWCRCHSQRGGNQAATNPTDTKGQFTQVPMLHWIMLVLALVAAQQNARIDSDLILVFLCAALLGMVTKIHEFMTNFILWTSPKPVNIDNLWRLRAHAHTHTHTHLWKN